MKSISKIRSIVLFLVVIMCVGDYMWWFILYYREIYFMEVLKGKNKSIEMIKSDREKEEE